MPEFKRKSMLNVILLILLGVALIFLETVLVGGVWCVAGVCLCAWAVWLCYADFGVVAAAAAAVFSLAACVGAFLVWLYVIPKTRLGGKMFLFSSQEGRASNAEFKSLVGAEGVAESMLMPSGKVAIGGRLYDARCEFQHIEAGSKVKVVSADTFSLVVKKI